MRILLVADSSDRQDEISRTARAAGIECDITRARTFSGAALVALQADWRAVLIDQELGRSDGSGLMALRQMLPRAPFVALGGHAPWAVSAGIGQLIPPPIDWHQLLLALDPDRLGIAMQPRALMPSQPASSIRPLVEEAMALLGKPTAVQMARDFRARRAERSAWHPWAPAFDWLLAGAPTPIPPYVTATAREMRHLRAIPRVLDEADLRDRVRERISRESEAAVYEATMAGGARLLGHDAHWTAITGEDTADVLIRAPGPVEIQVKGRRPRSGDPMDPPAALFRRLREGADQTRKDRVAIVALVVSGAPDWQTWREGPAGRAFLLQVRDVLLREPRFANVPVVLLAAGPHAAGTLTEQSVFQPGWQIFNVTARVRLPATLSLFNP